MSKIAMRYADLIFLELSSQIDALKRESRRATDDEPDNVVAYADLPDVADMNTPEIFFVTDGLKEGETTPGSGVICYYDPVASKYLRLSDNVEVTT